MPDAAVPTFRFGKHPPKYDYRTLRFKNYLKAGIAAPPPSVDVLARVYQTLGDNDPKELFPIDGNDQYGSCTIAAMAHAVTTWSGLTAVKNIIVDKKVLKVYFQLTGGPDTGLYVLDVLNYWRQNRFADAPILAFAGLNPHDHVQIQQAIQLFGGVYLGFQVQQNCVQDFFARKPWTPGPLLNEGHAVFAVGYDQNYVTVLTWGNTQQGEWAWWDECVDEAYVILPPQAADPQFAPGFDIQQLQADLAEVASGVGY